MAVLVYSEIQDIALDRSQANVATDPPFTAAEIARHLNEAYADVYEASGGAVLAATSAVAWTTVTAGHSFTSKVFTMGEVVNVWSTVADGVGGAVATDVPLDRKELEYILALRASAAGLGTYATQKVYSITRIHSVTPSALPTLRMDVYPTVTGRFFPVEYIPQFVPIDSSTVTTPNVSDIESRDIALVAAARMAPLIGRAELVPSIVMDISERTQKALDRKFSALLDARQDR